MSRKLTPRSSLQNLKKEAKQWLKALRANDPDARARFVRAHPHAPATPTLRDVQFALAREHGFSGWNALKAHLEQRLTGAAPDHRDAAVQALLAAAGRGDADAVRRLLDQHPDLVNERALLAGNTGARTPLHYGVHHEGVVRLLLERGADPNIRDEGDDAMPLHFAAERGDLPVVRLLVEHGADPVGEGTDHELNVLGWATCFDYAYHAEVAEYLLAHGAKHTIHTAVAMGDVRAIRELAARSPTDIEKPMDRTNRRRRPLHLAVVKKRLDSLAALLELGVDTELEDAAGLTPLDQAALSGERQMAQRLIDHGATLRLPAAVALERDADIQRLLHADPDCLRPGGRWDKLILRAAETAPGHIVEQLIRAGASVHVYDDSQTAVDQARRYTALHAAVAARNAEAVRVLLRHGADPTAREEKYWGTPAGWADYFGRTELRDVILEGPIDIFDAVLFRSDRIDEILMRDPLALERPFGEYVTGDPQSKPWLDPKWTPLAYAIAHGKLDAVRILLDRGADLGARDSAGRTPTDLAKAAGPEMLSLIEQHRASRG
jgi:ankyrin repeat protein